MSCGIWPVYPAGRASTADLTAPTPPAQGPPEASGTTSVSLTYTHAGAPGGTTYALSVTDIATGDPITPTSGSGLGPYAIPTTDGLTAVHWMTATGTDGQTSRSTAGAIVVEASPALAWETPATVASEAGQTSGVVTWATPTGGTAPYSYGAAAVVYDSEGASTTAALSTAGAGAGATTVSGLVNGQTVVIQRTVTDAASASVTVQAAVTIAATAAGVTPGTAPAGQSLAAGTTAVTIGTWGAPSGGTAPYTYGVTELGGSGVTITGSGLGTWSATGLTDGVTYAFLLTITDNVGAKGYSVVTVSVAAALSGGWELVDDLDFTDADWATMSSTDATASTTVWQHTLYALDGVTPRAYVYNNSTQARTLSLSPSADGLTFVNGTNTAQPTIGVWPAGWESLMGGSRRDVWLVEAVVGGEEPAGTGALVHVFNLSTATTTGVVTPGTGLRVVNSGSGVSIRANSYISSAAEQAIQTLTPSPTRAYTCGVQVTIADSRRHDVYITPGATTVADPLTGQRVRVQATSTTMTTPGADVTTSAAWFAATISGRTKFWLYHDGTATVGSSIRVMRLRLLRLPRGSM